MEEKLYRKIYSLIRIKSIAFIVTTFLGFCLRIYFILKFKIYNLNSNVQSVNYTSSINYIKKLNDAKVIHCEKIIRSNQIKYDLSVIVPVYNGEVLIEKCIDSIINQKTSFYFEIIIINDGSTDKTSLLLEKYRQGNITIITQKNMGISAARNMGLSSAAGEYLMFVDSDDVLYPLAIENLLKRAKELNADIVEGNFYYINSQGNKKIGKIDWNREKIFDLRKDKQIIKSTFGFPWGRVYSRKLWDNIQFPVGLDFEDTIIKSIIFRRAVTYVQIPNFVYGYYLNENSITNTIKRTFKNLDSYYIIPYIISENSRLNLEFDVIFYNQILFQMGTILYNRINFLDYIAKYHLLVLLKVILDNIETYSPNELTFKEYYLKKSIQNLNVKQWELVCRFL